MIGFLIMKRLKDFDFRNCAATPRFLRYGRNDGSIGKTIPNRQLYTHIIPSAVEGSRRSAAKLLSNNYDTIIKFNHRLRSFNS